MSRQRAGPIHSIEPLIHVNQGGP